MMRTSVRCIRALSALLPPPAHWRHCRAPRAPCGTRLRWQPAILRRLPARWPRGCWATSSRSLGDAARLLTASQSLSLSSFSCARTASSRRRSPAEGVTGVGARCPRLPACLTPRRCSARQTSPVGAPVLTEPGTVRRLDRGMPLISALSRSGVSRAWSGHG